MFLFGPFATYMPTVFFLGVFLLAGAAYLFRNNPERIPVLGRSVTFPILARITILFRIGFAVFLTCAQYYIWSQDAFTRTFLTAPLSPSLPVWAVRYIPWIFSSQAGYFIFYSWGRFWFNALLAVGISFLWWLFLGFLRRRNERFFEIGEPELGFLMALIVGWPGIVLFVPLVFAFVVLVSLFRSAVLKKPFTTLGWPFLLAALATLIFGNMLLTVLGFTVLNA
jgi:hypothetical protein